MPERFEIYMVYKIALYTYSSFPFLSRLPQTNPRDALRYGHRVVQNWKLV